SRGRPRSACQVRGDARGRQRGRQGTVLRRQHGRALVGERRAGPGPGNGVRSFESFDGLTLAYESYGSPGGVPVLLLHGFAADSEANWVRPHVVEALVDAGRRAITLDARGHGRSDKPHDPTAYADGAMVRDARALLDHLGVEEVAVR